MKIEPIGFQFPQSQQIDSLQVQTDTAPSTTALDITSQGLQGVQRAAEQFSNTTQRSTQSTQQTAALLQENSQRVAQAQSAVLQQSAQNSNNFSQSLQGLQQGIGTLLSYDAKMKEIGEEQRKEAERKAAAELAAIEKAQREQRKAAAVDDLERIQTQWISGGKIRDLGTDAYLDAVTKRVADADLTGDDTVSLTQKYAESAHQRSKEIYEGQQDIAKEITQKRNASNELLLVAPLNGTLGAIKASANMSREEVDKLWATYNTGIRDILNNTSYSEVVRANAVATALETGLKGMAESNDSYLRMQQDASAYRNLAAYAAQQRQLVNQSKLPIQEYQDSIRIKALELGVTGFSVPDPNAEGKFLEERKQTEQNLIELRRKEVLSETEFIEADAAIVGGLAIDSVLDPSGAGSAVRALAKQGADKNAIEAVRVADDFIKFRTTEKPAYDLSRARKATEIANVSKSFNAWFISNTKSPGAAASNPALAKQLEILRGAGITPEALQGGQLTPAQVNLMQQSSEAVVQSLIAEQTVEDTNFVNRNKEFARYGLYLNEADTKASRASFAAKIDSYNKRKAEIEQDAAQTTSPQQQGITGTFKNGPIKQLTKRSYNGRSMVVPFAPNVANSMPDISSGDQMHYGAVRDGGSRSHQGLDFAVATGTEVLSSVTGTVYYVEPDNGRKGYGLNVGILGGDGLVYHYAHLSAANVIAGQRVEAGEVVALSGESGSPGSQHLHFGVHTKDRSKAFNPEEILANHSAQGGPQPRSAGFTQPSIPRGAVPIGKSKFLLNGKLYDLANPQKAISVATAVKDRGGEGAIGNSPLMQLTGGRTAPPSAGTSNIRSGMQRSAGTQQSGATRPALRQVATSPAQPVKNSYASNRREDYPSNVQPDHHHGYTKLANDKPLAREINRVANKYNMPGQWLADVIAYESAGTFSPKIDNGMGFSGLIQFGDAILQDLGISRSQLNNSTAAEQMKYVDAYLGLRLRQSGVKEYKGPEWLVAGINQGNVGIQQVDRKGAAAVLDPQNNDGYTTLLKYMQTLGKYSGRQYNYLGNRSKRTSAVIHTYHRSGCAFCAQLGDSFIRHEAPLS
jgi:murein DD-endopeptidase MepM/ murein hydrolase activator NlpD